MKKIWRNEEGVSPVIAVILMVAITVVLAAVLYVMVSGMMGGTTTVPTGALDFKEKTVGNYTGGIVSLSGDVKLSDASVTIIDNTDLSTKSSGPPLTASTTITTDGGMTLKYSDTNSNQKLDAGDVWTVTNGGSGDEIKLIHKDGKAIATYILK